MAKTRATHKTTSSADTPGAETVIDGRLAGDGLLSRLRQHSPVTAGLVAAIMLALGLSAWPYIAPYLTAPSDDPWQLSVEQELADLRSELAVLGARQDKITQGLQGLQAGQAELDETMADLVRSMAQSVETVTAAIDRFDQQIAYLSEQSSASSAESQQAQPAAASVQTDQQTSLTDPASSDQPASRQDSSADGSGLLPELSVPDVFGLWQGLSEWFGGLVSVDRISREQSEQQ